MGVCFWHKSQRYLDRITPFIDIPLNKAISGMRRTGKSTILTQVMESLAGKGADRERVVHINMASLYNVPFRDISVPHQLVKTKKAAL
jgi:predicted AAA+ superfamily ATPase